MSSTPRSVSHRDPEEDFATLTELFAVMIESQRGQALSPEDAWINHAQISMKPLLLVLTLVSAEHRSKFSGGRGQT